MSTMNNNISLNIFKKDATYSQRANNLGLVMGASVFISALISLLLDKSNVGVARNQLLKTILGGGVSWVVIRLLAEYADKVYDSSSNPSGNPLILEGVQRNPVDDTQSRHMTHDDISTLVLNPIENGDRIHYPVMPVYDVRQPAKDSSMIDFDTVPDYVRKYNDMGRNL